MRGEIKYAKTTVKSRSKGAAIVAQGKAIPSRASIASNAHTTGRSSVKSTRKSYASADGARNSRDAEDSAFAHSPRRGRDAAVAAGSLRVELDRSPTKRELLHGKYLLMQMY